MNVHEVPALAVLVMTLARVQALAAEETDSESDWLARFAFAPPAANAEQVCVPYGSGLPEFTVAPASSGTQIVRVSLPFPAGTFPAELGLGVTSGNARAQPDIRVLTYHPGRPQCVRRAVLTFTFDFPDNTAREFGLALVPHRADTRKAVPNSAPFPLRIGPTSIKIAESSIEVQTEGKPTWRADLIAPPTTSKTPPKMEVIEQGRHYLWARLLVPDGQWPRIIEVRADSLGTVGVRAHLQWLGKGDTCAPSLGWRIAGLAAKPAEHKFGDGAEAWVTAESGRLAFPDAHLLRRGYVKVDGTSQVTYVRCLKSERVPHQEAAWRTASFVFESNGNAPWNVLFEPSHKVTIPARFFDAIYRCGSAPDLSAQPVLADAVRFHLDLIPKCAITGDDFGSVTGYLAGPFGMNRLNHCPPIFTQYFHTGDTRLREVALNWCANFHDLSIWWGGAETGDFGGTRYNNAQLSLDAGKVDYSFMWRSNTAVQFCTKGSTRSSMPTKRPVTRAWQPRCAGRWTTPVTRSTPARTTRATSAL